MFPPLDCPGGEGCAASGACCLPDGGCAETTPECCAESGGTSQGAGTLCSGACAPPVCIYKAVSLEGDCAGCPLALGELCRGAGCPNDTCAESFDKACGHPACTLGLELDACRAPGSEPPCPPAPGACCQPDGSCAPASAESCQDPGQTFVGAGSECQPLGACCREDDSCVETTSACCAATGGVFLGAADHCEPVNPCVESCLVIIENCPSFMGVGTAHTFFSTAFPGGGTWKWDVLQAADQLAPTTGVGATLTVAAVKPSVVPGDVTVSVSYAVGKQQCAASCKLTVVGVDLDIDSDNDDLVFGPDRSAGEDGVEEELPGKFIAVNDDDDDQDQERDYEVEPLCPTLPEDDSVPLVVDIPPGLCGPHGQWRLVYTPDLEVYDPHHWSMRLLPGTGAWEPCPLDPAPLTLRVEGVDVSSSSGAQIRLEYDFDGDSEVDAQDTVVATVVKVDLDADSDNSSSAADLAPDRDEFEDRLEDHDDKPGRYVAVNDDDDDQSGLKDFAEWSNGSEDDFVRIVLEVPQPVDLDQARVRFDYPASPPGAVSITPEPHRIVRVPGGHIRVWTKRGSAARDPKPVTEGGDYVAPLNYPAKDLGLGRLVPDSNGGVTKSREVSLWVEGVRRSPTPGDVVIEVLLEPDGSHGPAAFLSHDVIRLTVLSVDVDVDSDNDDGTGLPERSSEEDAAEDRRGEPDQTGKLLCVNDDDDEWVDLDGDGTNEQGDNVPDFADGYERDGVLGSPDDANPAENDFVPLVVHLPRPVDPDKARLRFDYVHSDPVKVQVSAPAHPWKRPGLAGAPGGRLRIWTRPGTEPRLPASVSASPNPGHYVPKGIHDATALGFDAQHDTVVLHVEGVWPSAGLASDRILVEVDPDGAGGPADFLSEDAVRLTDVRLPYLPQTSGTQPLASPNAIPNPGVIPHVDFASLRSRAIFQLDNRRVRPTAFGGADNPRVSWRAVSAPDGRVVFRDLQGTRAEVLGVTEGEVALQVLLDGVPMSCPPMRARVKGLLDVWVRVNVVLATEDINDNGVLDPGEDTDGDPAILSLPNAVDTLAEVRQIVRRMHVFWRQAGIRVRLEPDQALGAVPAGVVATALADGVFRLRVRPDVFDGMALVPSTDAELGELRVVTAMNRSADPNVVHVYSVARLGDAYGLSFPGTATSTTEEPSALVLSQATLDALAPLFDDRPFVVVDGLNKPGVGTLDWWGIVFAHELGHQLRLAHPDGFPLADATGLPLSDVSPLLRPDDGRNLMTGTGRSPPGREDLLQRQAEVAADSDFVRD